MALILLYTTFSVLASPTLYIQPRDGIAPILNAINAAKTSIRLKIYLLTESKQDVIDALSAAIRWMPTGNWAW